MKCPYCNYEETQVIDTRETENLETTRRRRECLKCNKRFTTYERVEEAEIIVVKKDGKRERFERQKLTNGILKACEKRSIPLEKIEKLVDEVESDLRKRDSVEVESRGLLVVPVLPASNRYCAWSSSPRPSSRP